MKIDLYTKSILTVIAASLLYLCFGKPAMVQTVQAADPVAPQVVKIEGVVPVRIAAVERLQNPQTGQWSEWQPLITRPAQ